jgi:O-antigen ligase
MALLLALLLVALPTPDGWVVTVSVAIVVCTFWKPLVGLAAVPFVVAFGSLFSFNVHGLHAGPTDVLVGALAASALYRAYHGWWLRLSDRPRPDVEPNTPWVDQLRRQLSTWWRRERLLILNLIAVLAYVVVVMLSVGVAENTSLALKEVIKWTEVLILLGVSLTMIRSVADVHRIAWAMIAAGIFQALLGLWQWIQVTGSHASNAETLRVFGTFGQPNPFAGYLNFGLLLALALALFTREARERWVAAAAAAIIAFATVLADSRGAELGLATAIAVLLVVAWRRERIAGIALLIGVPVLALAWFFGIIPARLREDLLQQVSLGPVNAANFSIQERLAHWVAGWRMFQAHPLLGVGAGNYSAVYARYQVSPVWFEALGHAHNYYINAAAETGMLGLIAIFSVVGISLWAGWRAVRALAAHSQADVSIGWALALGLLAALVAHSVHNLTDDLFVHGLELQFGLCIACLLSLLRLSREPQQLRESQS